MSNQPRQPRLAPAILRAVPPAYVFPAASAFANAQAIGSDSLATAALTTIAVPSAAAAAAVTVRDHVRPRERSFARAATSGAVLGFMPTAALTGVLVATDIASTTMVAEAPPSAAIGGAIASVLAARRARRANEEIKQALTPSAVHDETNLRSMRIAQLAEAQ